MAFVVYNTNTTAIVRSKPFVDAVFKTMGAARACKTRLLKKVDRRTGAPEYTANDLEVADYEIYNLLIAGTREVTNIMTGKVVRESVNTPYGCSVGDEAYWSN